MAQEVTFSVFADFHYKKGMYAASVADMEKIFERAYNDQAEFVVHLGDMCNDYKGSPELISAYKNNRYGYEVYGVYGNHELETVGNTMPLVTPLITNRCDSVKWGTDSQNIEDGNIAYYYFDKGVFRFICIDSNYSLDITTQKYEHNRPASWGKPDGNLYPNSLGEKQLKWLEEKLVLSVKQDKKCIILSHSSFSGLWQKCNDAKAVRTLFKKANDIKKNTVILALNGHLHTNHKAVVDGVAYVDICAVRNGWWQGDKFDPYKEENINSPKYTFEYTEYDKEGIETGKCLRPLSSLSMGAQSLFYISPMSATITVSEDGSIKVKGSETEWMYGKTLEKLDNMSLLKIEDSEIILN